MQAAGQVLQLESPTSGTIAELNIYPCKIVRSGQPLLSLGMPATTTQTNLKETQIQWKDKKMTKQASSIAAGR